MHNSAIEDSSSVRRSNASRFIRSLSGHVLIRAEKECDQGSIRAVNVSAFRTASEADLVDKLRRHACPIVSLVAEARGEIVGHIIFSPVSLSGHPDLKIMGLGPMAVKPAYQRKGIGSALVLAGLEQCRKLDFGAVVVLGHASFYPRFGFLPSSRFGINSEYDVPDELFMVMELRANALDRKSGTITYHRAFSEL